MRHKPTPRILLTLLAPVLFVSSAQAQLGGSLDSFSLPSANAPQPPAGPQTIDKIAAVVNDDVILQSELDSAVDRIRQRAAAQVSNVPPNVLRSQVLDQLIIRQLQIERANDDKIKVSNQELDDGLDRIAQQNNMNLQQLTQAVASSGQSMADLRSQVRDEILISKVRQKEVLSQVGVSDADVDTYLANQSLRLSREHQYHLREILLKLPDDADSTTVGVARDNLNGLRQKINNGKITFAAAASAQSQGPNAADGGDMGWLTGAQLPDAFDSVLPGMQAGSVSPVFRGPDGVYVIKLEEERGGSDAPDTGKKVMVSEVKAQHILLKANAIRGDAQTRKLAQEIHSRLAAGDSFAALARKYSDDNSTAEQGGDIGWVPSGHLDPTTRSQIESLKDGQISPIFETSDGYEIIKVTGHRQRDETDEARREQARQVLGKQRTSEQGDLWLRRLRDEAYVDIRMPGYDPSPDSKS